MFGKNPAARRYTVRFLIAMTFYCIAISIAVWTFTHRHPEGAMAYLLAMLPALPCVGILAAVGLYLSEEKDEFQQMMVVQAMLWGIGATLSVATVWGFLDNFTDVPRLSGYLMFSIFWAFVALSSCVLHLRYR